MSFDESLSTLLQVAKRRRWWMLIPATVIALGACVTSLLLPAHYESEATILVERQQVPERYVTANSTIDVREVLLSMTDAILSRTQLLQIIDEFGLYPKERRNLAPEQLVELMRSDIEIEPYQKNSQGTDLNAFKISYTGRDPHTAQAVATKLTRLFIEKSDKSREEQATGTTSFLSDQLATAAVDLQKQESQVREFKMQALGELPEQQQENLAILAGLHAQLQNTMSTLARAREQQVYLQSLLSQYESLSPVPVASPAAGAANPQDALRTELNQLQNERAGLLARYTPEYPDVVKLDGEIKNVKAMLAASTKASKSSTEGTDSGTPQAGPTGGNATTAQLKSQLEANRLEIQNALNDQKQIEDHIADYQRRLNLTPVREEQLAELLRGYDQSKQHYDDLLNKKTQSELATSLERRQEGQRFNIIDPPSLPMKPSSPDHVKISLAGLLAGIVVGAALAFLVESRDHSLRDEQDLRWTFSFPLMLGVPVLLSKAEQRRRSRMAVLEWLLATTLCLLICATEFYVYRRG